MPNLNVNLKPLLSGRGEIKVKILLMRNFSESGVKYKYGFLLRLKKHGYTIEITRMRRGLIMKNLRSV